MKKSVLFYCNHIHANLGVPGVYQALISDLSGYGNEDLTVYGSDYHKFYSFRWSKDGSIKKTEVSPANLRNPDTVVFSAFDPLRFMLPAALKWKIAKSTICFWSWGYHTRQQCQGNWEGGKAPLWAKKIATKVKRFGMAPLVSHYFVSGKAEREDSGLPEAKCLQMPMGRPQSAILDAADETPPQETSFSNEILSYIGRGVWESKGVRNIVEYSKSPNGRAWEYHFLVSAQENGFHERIKETQAENLHWNFEVRGAGNLPWLQKSAAFLTINLNPTQIRTPYEALYAGTPIVVCRECYMDGFAEVFRTQGLPDCVQIVSREDLVSKAFEIVVIAEEDRRKQMKIMRKVLDRDYFSKWLSTWLMEPKTPASYYSAVAASLNLGSEDSLAE